MTEKQSKEEFSRDYGELFTAMIETSKTNESFALTESEAMLLFNKFTDVVSRLGKRVLRYEEALGFYADKKNYEEWNNIDDLTEYIHNVDHDEGDRARKALEVEGDGNK